VPISHLNSNYAFVALNVSNQLKDMPWANFRFGRHDRKLKYACNDTALRGSYLTDLFKGIAEPVAVRLKDILSPEVIRSHVSVFEKELEDIKLHSDSTLIVLGDAARRYFEEHFNKKNRRAEYYCHYSYTGLTDKQWIEGLWRQLGIEADFDAIAVKYKMFR
jgi:hypothetical protein